MKLFNRNTLNVIVLIPVVAIAMSEDGGCASTQEARPGPLTAEQIKATIPGNTFKLPGDEIYALVETDGRLKGLNLPSGATEGKWRVSDNGVLCATWETPEGSSENCDALAFFSPEIGYQWGGNTLELVEGNPKDL